MEKTQALAAAEILHTVRPDWEKTLIVGLMWSNRDSMPPMLAFMRGALEVAETPGTTPAVIFGPGDHWHYPKTVERVVEKIVEIERKVSGERPESFEQTPACADHPQHKLGFCPMCRAIAERQAADRAAALDAGTGTGSTWRDRFAAEFEQGVEERVARFTPNTMLSAELSRPPAPRNPLDAQTPTEGILTPQNATQSIGPHLTDPEESD